MSNHKSFKLVRWGKEKFEATTEFSNKIAAIKKEVRTKYMHTLATEKNILKKLWLQVVILVEIRKRVEQISSSRNLHFQSS